MLMLRLLIFHQVRSLCQSSWRGLREMSGSWISSNWTWMPVDGSKNTGEGHNEVPYAIPRQTGRTKEHWSTMLDGDFCCIQVFLQHITILHVLVDLFCTNVFSSYVLKSWCHSQSNTAPNQGKAELNLWFGFNSIHYTRTRLAAWQKHVVVQLRTYAQGEDWQQPCL